MASELLDPATARAAASLPIGAALSVRGRGAVAADKSAHAACIWAERPAGRRTRHVHCSADACTSCTAGPSEIARAFPRLWHLASMDEQQLPDSQLAAIFLEASYLHEQAMAACLEEAGEEFDLCDAPSRALVERALLHAERAAACAGVRRTPLVARKTGRLPNVPWCWIGWRCRRCAPRSPMCG